MFMCEGLARGLFGVPEALHQLVFDVGTPWVFSTLSIPIPIAICTYIRGYGFQWVCTWIWV